MCLEQLQEEGDGYSITEEDYVEERLQFSDLCKK